MVTMMRFVFAALMIGGTVGIGSALGLGSAPIVHAAPAFCDQDRYITACAPGSSNGGAFADADGDGVLNGMDTTRTGGPGVI